ncbi:hypothetical protein HY214_00120 [Candidatus Roizmanbacteria bacterium]|nr:hypothetical protein [Candidatus Roizmanbacteria bacterium]
MVQISGDPQAGIREIPGFGVNFKIVKNWPGTVLSLEHQAGLEALVKQMGFDLPTLAATLNREFSQGLTPYPVHNAAGEKIEDIIAETIIVNNRLLDRLLVTAHPLVANPNPTEMTKFRTGGEVILVTEGAAEITFAPRVTDNIIAKSGLITTRVENGDLIVSTDTPNNWTQVLGDKFTFIYFVGNPNGSQKYSDIPKEKISVK